MTTEEEKELRHLFWRIRQKLTAWDWSLNIKQNSSEGYCWERDKVIDVGAESDNPKRLLVHEFAHVYTARFCNNKHNRQFVRTLKRYMNEFLPGVPISEYDSWYLNHDRDGYYKACYRGW